MNVDLLPRGRNQPFYTVLCNEEHATRRCKFKLASLFVFRRLILQPRCSRRKHGYL
jgi:hypothetical protein